MCKILNNIECLDSHELTKLMNKTFNYSVRFDQINRTCDVQTVCAILYFWTKAHEKTKSRKLIYSLNVARSIILQIFASVNFSMHRKSQSGSMKKTKIASDPPQLELFASWCLTSVTRILACRAKLRHLPDNELTVRVEGRKETSPDWIVSGCRVLHPRHITEPLLVHGRSDAIHTVNPPRNTHPNQPRKHPMGSCRGSQWRFAFPFFLFFFFFFATIVRNLRYVLRRRGYISFVQS